MALKTTHWTIENIRALGSVTTVDKAAEIIGIGRTHAYALARENEFPIPTKRIGRHYKVPVPEILSFLGAE